MRRGLRKGLSELKEESGIAEVHRGLREDIAELKAYSALAAGNVAEASKLFEKAQGIPKDRLARVHLALGDRVKAEMLAKEACVGIRAAR